MMKLLADMETKDFGVVNTPFESYNSPLGIALLVSRLIGLITIASGIILVIMLAYGGFRFVTAGGNDKATAQAQGIMTNAVVGMVIVVASYMIAFLVGKFLGFNILTPTIYGPVFWDPANPTTVPAWLVPILQ